MLPAPTRAAAAGGGGGTWGGVGGGSHQHWARGTQPLAIAEGSAAAPPGGVPLPRCHGAAAPGLCPPRQAAVTVAWAPSRSAHNPTWGSR